MKLRFSLQPQPTSHSFPPGRSRLRARTTLHWLLEPGAESQPAPCSCRGCDIKSGFPVGSSLQTITPPHWSPTSTLRFRLCRYHLVWRGSLSPQVTCLPEATPTCSGFSVHLRVSHSTDPLIPTSPPPSVTYRNNSLPVSKFLSSPAHLRNM